MSAKKKCRCIIKHPDNEEERAAIKENLDYFRKIGDSNGILLAIGQLQGCPTD